MPFYWRILCKVESRKAIKIKWTNLPFSLSPSPPLSLSLSLYLSLSLFHSSCACRGSSFKWNFNESNLSHTLCLSFICLYFCSLSLFVTHSSPLSVQIISKGGSTGLLVMFERSWVRIPAQYTGWTFLHWFVVKIVLFVWKRPKINEKRGRGWSI